MFKFLGLSLVILILCQCKKKNAETTSTKPQETIEPREGFTADDLPIAKKSVTIPKEKLQLEYIFQVSMTSLSPAPEFNSIKSRIVSFKQEGDSLLMLESAIGNSIAANKSQGILLAKFPILRTSESDITFDFNHGMSKLFLMGDLFAEDIYGKEFDAGAKWSALEFNESWLSSVEAKPESDSYEITQKGQLKMVDLSGLNRLYPVTVDYSLNLYKPNPEFQIVKSFAKNHVGFFEVSPQLRKGGGDTILYSSKFHIADSQEIVYQISKNTPEEYVDAIKHGVLYWNRVFGREVFKVEHQGDNATAKHLIQWVDWKNAPYAYADMSMDPRSGEILKAKVFLTSAFAFDAKIQARMFLSGLQNTESVAFKFKSLERFNYNRNFAPDELDKVQQSLGSELNNLFEIDKIIGHKNQVQGMSIKGFSPIKYCSLHFGPRDYSHFLSASAHSHLNQSQVLRISQDMITAVVAHEIGHNIGLRHNFAGSLATNYSSEEFAKDYNAYASSDNSFSKTLSSTVMDYLGFKNSSALGAYIRKGGAALSYDKKAVDILYNNKPLLVDGIYFCTDTQKNTYVDCDVFDSGDSVFSRIKWAEKEAIDGLPIMIAELFRAAKYPPEGFEPSPIAELTLSAERFAAMIVWHRLKILAAISDNAKYLTIRSKYPSISDINRQKVEAAEQAYLNQVLPSGSLQGYFGDFDPENIASAYQRFEKVFNNMLTNSGTVEKSETFSQAEISLIFAKVKDFYEKLPYALALWDLGVAIFPRTFLDIKAVNEDLPGIIGQKLKLILTQTLSENLAGKVKLNSNDSEKQVSVPVYQFPAEVRFAATFGLSNHKVKDNLLWGVRKSEEVNKAVFQVINDHAFSQTGALRNGENILEHAYENWTNSEDPDAQRRLRNWVVENQAILLSLKTNGPLY